MPKMPKMPKDISYTSVSWCGRELTINYGIFVGTPSKSGERSSASIIAIWITKLFNV